MEPAGLAALAGSSAGSQGDGDTSACFCSPWSPGDDAAGINWDAET